MERRPLTVGSCFSGIGGLELGLEWTGGFKTEWQVENDPYATKVLEKHWPQAKRYSDITTVDAGDLAAVDVICGGFPCQDISLAGARAGLGGKRSTLWGEMHRLIRALRPRWVVAENVPGLLSSDGGRFFGNVLRDLAAAGYDAEWGVLSAAGVGAPHLRRRVFILAHAHSEHGQRRRQPHDVPDAQGLGAQGRARQQQVPVAIAGSDGDTQPVADSYSPRRQEQCRAQPVGTEQRSPECGGQEMADAKSESQRAGFCKDESQGERSRRLSDRSGTPKLSKAIDHGSHRAQENAAEPGGNGPHNRVFVGDNCWSTQCRLGIASHGLPRRLDCGGWECGIPRVTKGQKNRTERLKCLGNAVVPQCAQKIGEMILEMKNALQL